MIIFNLKINKTLLVVLEASYTTRKSRKGCAALVGEFADDRAEQYPIPVKKNLFPKLTLASPRLPQRAQESAHFAPEEEEEEEQANRSQCSYGDPGALVPERTRQTLCL